MYSFFHVFARNSSGIYSVASFLYFVRLAGKINNVSAKIQSAVQIKT